MSIKFSSSDILAQFPIAPADMPKIATATTRPTYTSLAKFQDAINSQALAVPIPQETLGHLALVITPTEFESVNNAQAFVPPANPGPNPTHTAGSTQFEITETNRIHQVNTNTYNIFVNTRIHLRNLIIQNCAL